MKQVLVNVQWESYLMEAPDFIIDNIEKYKKIFLKWLYDKNNNHKLWVIENGKKLGVCYSAIDFVDYINQYIIKDNQQICSLKPFELEQKSDLKTIFF